MNARRNLESLPQPPTHWGNPLYANVSRGCKECRLLHQEHADTLKTGAASLRIVQCYQYAKLCKAYK